MAIGRALTTESDRVQGAGHSFRRHGITPGVDPSRRVEVWPLSDMGQRRDDGCKLNLVVGCRRLSSRQFGSFNGGFTFHLVDDSTPSTRAGIAGASPVDVDDEI